MVYWFGRFHKETDWKDCLVAFTNEAAVGCYAATYGELTNGESNPSWGLTVGTKTTANSDYKAIIKISYPASSVKKITQMTFTWDS